MKYLIFKNDGEVSPQEIKTFGMSIKKEGAIGFFGTGLKYAIAISCRLDEAITIMSGHTTYAFAKRNENVRGKEFDFIEMISMYNNDTQRDTLAFTTHVGAKWEPWMCVREVLCNCVDEGGTYYESDELPTPAAGVTFVVMGGLFVDIPMEEYALTQQGTPILSTSALDVYNARSQFVYYKGVRVEAAPKAYRYTYNIKSDITLGEDRVAHDYYKGYAICTPIIQSDNETLIRAIIQASKDTGEGKLLYSSYNVNAHASETTKRMIREIYKNDGLLVEWAKDAASGLLTEEDHLEKVKEAVLNDDQTEAFVQAINRVSKYFPIFDYKIRIVSMSDHIYGKAYMGQKMIALNANRLGSENPEQIVKTLLEEYLHLRFEAGDYGRAWQEGALTMMTELMEKNERTQREITDLDYERMEAE